MPLGDSLVLDEEGANEEPWRLARPQTDDVGLALLVGVGAQHNEICLRQVQHSDAWVTLEEIGGADVGDAAGTESPRRPLSPRIWDLAEEHDNASTQFMNVPAARVSGSWAAPASPSSNLTCTRSS